MLSEFKSLKKNNELVKEPFVRLWTGDSVVVTQNHIIQIFNQDLHIIHSFTLKEQFKKRAVLKEKTIYAQAKELLEVDIDTNQIQATQQSVYFFDFLDGELVKVLDNGTIQSKHINVVQSGTVLHAEIVDGRLAMILKSDDDKTYVQYFTQDSKTEFEIQVNEKPLEFAIDKSQLVLQSRQKQFVAPVQSFATIASLGDSCVLLHQVDGNAIAEVWEPKYGTRTFSKTILQDLENSKRVFEISRGKLDIHGDVLLIAVATKQGKLYSIECGLVPYTAKPVSLLDSIGKLTIAEPNFDKDSFQGQLSSVIPIQPPTEIQKRKPLKVWKRQVVEWNDLDHRYVTSLVTKTDTEEFQSLFVEWLFAKHSSLRNWCVVGVPKLKKSIANGKSKSLLQLPQTELAHKPMSLIIRHCFENSKQFWPRAVVEYLIHTGNVSSKMVNGFIDTLIQFKDLDLIAASFEFVMDLEESDYIKVLQFVTDQANQSVFREWSEEKEKQYQEKIKDLNPHRVAREPETIMKKNQMDADPSELGIELNEGQKDFIYYCFSYLYAHGAMARELKKLTLPQLFTVFEWIRNIIAAKYDQDYNNQAPNQKFPLWWMWYDTPFYEPYKELLDLEFKKYNTALDALALIIDAHIATLKFTPDLQAVIAELYAIIKRDAKMLSKMDLRLRGPLMATVSKESQDKHRKECQARRNDDQYNKNWNRMVNHMQAAVGEYQVEVFEL